MSTPIQIVHGVGGLTNRGKGNYVAQMPHIIWNQRKCTKLAETPTESSPIQPGRGGRILIELADSRMLCGKTVMSPRFFAEKNQRGKVKHTSSFHTPRGKWVPFTYFPPLFSLHVPSGTLLVGIVAGGASVNNPR